MRKRNRKFVSILLTFALLATLLLPAGAAIAADPATNVTSAVANITTGDQKDLGYIEIKDGSQVTSATDVTQVNIELPSNVEWDSSLLAANTANIANFVKKSDGTALGAALSFVEHSKSTLTFNVTGSLTTLTGVKVNLDYDDGVVTLSSKAKVGSSVSGNIAAKVTVTVMSGAYERWSQTSDHIVGNVSTGELTATAKDPEIFGSTGLNKTAATITIEENKTGVFAAPETITLSIVTDGVTFSAAPVASGVNTLAVGAGVLAADSKSVTYTVAAASAGIKGKLNFVPVLNVGPAASGDLQIEVSSTNSKLTNTTVTVAKLGEGEFNISNENVSDKTGYPGKIGVAVGTLVLEQNYLGAYKSNGSLVLTLTGAKWTTGAIPAPPAGFAAGAIYNDDRSVWYSVTGAPAKTAKFTLPTIRVDADAAPGDLMVTVSGTAGPAGEVKIATVQAAATYTADKPEVLANSLNQAAGNITLTETKNNAFTNGQTFTMKTPSGVSFAATPTVKVNGNKQTVTRVSDSEYNVGVMTASSASDKVEISDIKYNVDSRFVSSDIKLELSGTYLTAAGGSTNAIFKVANAAGVSSTKRAATFVIGSSEFTVNGNTVEMDVAPYIKDGRTYLPVRYVSQALGVSDSNILWDATAQTVTLIKGDKVVQMKIGSKALLVNGVTINMDVPAEISSDRTMLPFRFIAQALGATVGWDEATQTVTMDMK